MGFRRTDELTARIDRGIPEPSFKRLDGDRARGHARVDRFRNFIHNFKYMNIIF
jgi:hypothetical protein